MKCNHYLIPLMFCSILQLNAQAPCEKDPLTTGTEVSSLVGVSALRIKTDGSWVTNKKGGHLVLESNTKGFVLNKVSNPETDIPSTDWVEGMAVYDTTEKCLKVYVVNTLEPANTGWTCMTNQTCND